MGCTLEYLESTALVYSNNDSGHAMVSFLGGTYNGKCSDIQRSSPICLRNTSLRTFWMSAIIPPAT